MPSLSNVLASIPGYGAYVAKRQLNEEQPLQEAQQAGALIGLQEKLRAQQEQAAVQQTLAGAKSPDEAIQKLMTVGTPGALALAAKLKGLQPEAPKPQPIGSGGLRLPDGTIIPPVERPDKPEPLSPLGKMMAERDRRAQTNPNDPLLKHYDRAITEFKGSGVNITGPLVNNMPLGKEASNKVDAGLLDTTQGVMRLSAIEGAYKPEFQQYSGKLGASWASIKDKAGVGLAPDESRFLTEFSAYRRNAIDSMNQYIKSVTGAAMSEAEAQRILKGMPNPGQGLFDGDSPTEFKSKLDDAMKQTRLALARYEYIKRNGIALTDANGNAIVPLERMPEIMNQRGRALEEQFKRANPSATPEQVQNSVRGILAKEFGLVK